MPVILAPGDYAHWLGEEPDSRDVMRRNRSDGQSFICLGAGSFEEKPRHELRHDAGCCACRVLV